jgi:hypothetical protein
MLAAVVCAEEKIAAAGHDRPDEGTCTAPVAALGWRQGRGLGSRVHRL